MEPPTRARPHARHRRLRRGLLRPDDLTEGSENAIEAEVSALVADRDVKIDVTNEARVHTWYQQRFGRALAPYRSAEHAIATWPTTATSVGIRTDDRQPVVCAPFGLADLFAMMIRPNTTLVDRAVYEAKAQRWHSLWPQPTVMPWPVPEAQATNDR